MGKFAVGAAVVVTVFAITVAPALASVGYYPNGSTYLENFNSLPTDPTNNAALQPTPYTNGWQDDTTTVAGNHISIPGWYLYHPTQPSGTEIGTNGHQRFREGTGQNTGSFWGFTSVAPTDTDKALGDIGSSTIAGDNVNIYVAVRLTNNTTDTLDSFTVTYDGEEYRDGQSTNPETLSFGYSTTATLTDWFSTATFTGVSGLNFTSPVFSGTGTSGTAVDGNVAGKVAGITSTISGIAWAPGTDLWLRWADPQIGPSLADDGLAVDNVQFTATPEPSGFALIGLAAVGLIRRARRRA